MAGHTAHFESWVVRAPDESLWDRSQHALDLMFVVLAAPLWVPVLLLVMTLKVLAEGRPVLFHHIRLGRAGRPFVLYKIRTTTPGFEPRPDDWSDETFPPRTPFGNWLRRFDLDELPQLWNVLKGDMSLVGPRPEMPLHSEAFSLAIPDYANRLAVRPGLTGLAQVRGWRGNTSIHQRLRADLEYIGRRGPGAYLAILLKTVAVQLRHARANSRRAKTFPEAECPATRPRAPYKPCPPDGSCD